MPGDTPEADRSMVVDTDASSHSIRRKRPSRRVVRSAAILIALVACLACFHEPILRGLAGILVVDELLPPAGSSSLPNCVLVVEGDARADSRYDETARLLHENGIRRVVFVQFRPDLVIRSGAVLPQHVQGRRALTSVGVPPGTIEIIPGDARNTWEAARQLQPWLKDHPTVRLLVLVHRLHSRHQRYVFDSVLEPSIAARIFVHAPMDSRCHEANWWKSRHGVKYVMFAGLELMYAWCRGEGRPSPNVWDPDQFEQTLRETIDGENPNRLTSDKGSP